MWKAAIAVVVGSCCAHIACAGVMQITESEVTWPTASESSSCWVTLGIEHTGTPDWLLVWNLVCQVGPIDGASGTAFVTNFAKPVDYVLGDDSLGIGQSNDSPLGYMFSDVAGDVINGVEVPDNGKNLLQIQLTFSNAVGRFDLVIVPNDTGLGSNWLSSTGLQQEFDVVYAPGRPQGVVASFVFVPEPSCSLLLLPGAVLIFFWSVRKIRATKSFRFSLP